MLRSLRSVRDATIMPLSWRDSVGSIVSGGYIPLTEEGCTRLGMQSLPTKRHPMKVIVPNEETRIQRHDELRCQIIATPIAGKPFVKVSPEFAIAGPELLFIDAVATMPLPRALLFGMEICGTYTLRQSFPSAERPVYQIEPATSVAKIAEVIELCRGSRIRGIDAARDALPFLMDNAASPMESVLALMLRLPLSRGGIGMGSPQLNPQVPVNEELRKFTSAELFHPDIYFKDYAIDLEYESEEFHPDLGDWDALDADSREAIANKAKEDKQRMRIIQSLGIRVFQVTYDDFKSDQALDLLIEQLLLYNTSLSAKGRRRRLKKLSEVKAVLARSNLLTALRDNREP